MAEKAKKMYETLQKFQAMKVRPFETEVERRLVAACPAGVVCGG